MSFTVSLFYEHVYHQRRCADHICAAGDFAVYADTTRKAADSGHRSADRSREFGQHVDQRLYPFSNVISSDSVVLNHCPSWINLNGGILPDISGVWSIDLME